VISEVLRVEPKRARVVLNLLEFLDSHLKMLILGRSQGRSMNGQTEQPQPRCPPLVKNVDVIAITIAFIGVIWGIAQRNNLPSVPL
jgi:hypothetical protein